MYFFCLSMLLLYVLWWEATSRFSRCQKGHVPYGTASEFPMRVIPPAPRRARIQPVCIHRVQGALQVPLAKDNKCRRKYVGNT